MAKYKNKYEIVSQSQLSDGIFDILIDCEEIAANARAGQFVNVFVEDASKLLPRPISICEIIENRFLRLVYRATKNNSGTNIISKLVQKDKVELMGPLGNGFLSELKLDAQVKNILLIGGGIGIPPMLELAKQVKYKFPHINSSSLLGYRDSQTFLSKEFEDVIPTVIVTDDGSVGYRGTTVDYLRQTANNPDIIMACGPTPMLAGLKEYCETEKILCYLSLEERMACGIGACLACMVNTENVNPNINISNRRICKEGPVFLSTDIII